MARHEVDVVVVGGGGMGSAAAWRLAGGGAEVVLLERFEEGHVRGASHGASRIFRVSYTEPVYIGLAQEAERSWRELEDASGVSLLTVTGGVDHGRTADLGLLAEAVEAAGAPGEWLAPEEAAERWPGLRYDGRVLFHPAGGRLHADDAVSALQAQAARLGAVVRHRTPVTAIVVRGDDAVEVRAGEDVYHAKRVVVAAGAWAGKLLGGLVPLPPLRVTQEQPAYFAPLGEAAWPSFVHHLDDASLAAAGYPSGVYGLGTPGEGVKAGFHGTGPVVDPDERDFLPEPAQGRALREYARAWLPGVDADAFTPISCTYTTTPTSDFVLDRVGPVVVAAGFSGHGFKFVPAVGRILAGLALTGERPDARFALDRPPVVA
ncbi:FAD-dependent oxidoreductase [Sphaerisporangium corydalis]|uniref:FAD-dependent oxidoreductase n=1 Tax=Sphaerisporangium corydalis TaxID=1441875 RepID=A0ABV9EJ40_9ACTN|nr:FAD-dependent oxidoreductase [Sphaerisporangium corydalis]